MEKYDEQAQRLEELQSESKSHADAQKEALGNVTRALKRSRASVRSIKTEVSLQFETFSKELLEAQESLLKRVSTFGCKAQEAIDGYKKKKYRLRGRSSETAKAHRG
eukprot:TRINITY_DN640_c0_g1_i1.p1 TRINITY_DN640_c0_g1~~TRINITY_DN640_c0_g1_i1.p1  ORF type:complete len:107 (+),score=33.23 TRINITY_DN640_c0_g1_i1:337-657(+)